MFALSRRSAKNQINDEEVSVLVLTDGSDRALRMAEWELFFTEFRGAHVHHLEVVKCCDSGVVLKQRESCMRNEQNNRDLVSSKVSTFESDQVVNSGFEVFYGRPSTAILEYANMHRIDILILAYKEKSSRQSFLESIFARIERTTSISVLSTSASIPREI